MSVPLDCQYMVVNTYHDGMENGESWLAFFKTEQDARNFISDSFENSDSVEAGYLIVPLDKCIAVYAEHCASKFTDVDYEDIM